MNRVIFLLEELSMKNFLEGFLPRFMPDLEFLCITHEGKQDLEKSIPRKLRVFRKNRVVIIRDNDGADCLAVKKKLSNICKIENRSDVLIRIACQTLEAWYLGAWDVLSDVYDYPKLVGLNRKAKYRDPDHLSRPYFELGALVPEFRKIDGARRMGMAMHVEKTKNCSRSFQVFMEGMERVVRNTGDRKHVKIIRSK
ncbi:MAG: DUF4276 family protein [Deltaproteobacteria bacterium]|nr:DUF4276 family protein [Deltaproteobacteria bacterium]